MSIRKILISALCLVLVAGISVLGTMAYLADQTDVVVNTFSMGKVGIRLDETKVDEYGNPVKDENGEAVDRVTTNNYKLIPGHTYTKDPTMTILPDSEDSYARIIMTIYNASAVQAIIDNHDLVDFSGLIDGWDEKVWLYKGFEHDAQADTISFEFRYHEKVSADDEEVKLPALFDKLVVPGGATVEELAALDKEGTDNDFRMELVGHAIQAIGFADAEDGSKTAMDLAWEAFDAQMAEDDNTASGTNSQPDNGTQPPADGNTAGA